MWERVREREWVPGDKVEVTSDQVGLFPMAGIHVDGVVRRGRGGRAQPSTGGRGRTCRRVRG